ncbi:hypothetical protein [Sphingomonas sp. BAUL-RG-20F-R05-02]|uniref:hypothetical protein n=1 Tax=Sphingomonas sp. BAUL-RG-20F-R05-02 TaxID=2914830 RepID=UPI001F56140A|nr:hypothetical protein [Sphingomonas sp. BAUL-RG-20F-R05-02]
MADDRQFAREVAARQIAMFNKFVGPGLHKTNKALAEASKIPDATLRGYANGVAMPISALLALTPHLPRAAINMLTEPGGLQLIDVERKSTNWNACGAAASVLTFEIFEATADGIIDHREEARLFDHARNLTAQLNHIAEVR